MGTETVQVSFPAGKRVDAQVGNFIICTDQSEKYGGEGSAPEPFDLFLASIASCAGVFALGFCHSRDLSTEGMSLAMDCERDDKKQLITRMTLRLTPPAGFPDKYRNGIVRAMELCAVKRHMQDCPEFAIMIE